MQEIVNYIQQNWDRTIRVNPADTGDLIGLPKPYTVPCISHRFQEMYYWDTYFTNVGLLLSGRLEQAQNNVENMSYLIERYGYMPNGNRVYYLSRSQPPFFSRMVRDVYRCTGDKTWLAGMARAAEKEYAFWQTQRMTPSGLNRYSGDWRQSRLESARELTARLGIALPAEDALLDQYAACMLAFSESGWDCNSRFGRRAHEFNPVDLNALLYGMEQDLAFFADELQTGRAAVWHERAGRRRELSDALLWDPVREQYGDYAYLRRERSPFFSAAAFYPLFTRMCTRAQAAATVRRLDALENPFGVAASERRPTPSGLQWDYPHGWACLQYLVIRGLANYGYTADSRRIAEKYTAVVERNFRRTGSLWEKYDTLTGEVSVTKEYESPEMMGWSAGVYLYCRSLLDGFGTANGPV